jgi:putative ubiquitin-RnfH superfamily antitoxin RatB of RatAB toxin-antitoxin module
VSAERTGAVAAPPVTESVDAGATIAVQVAWSPAPRETLVATLRLRHGASVATALAATGWPALASAQEGEEAFAANGLSAAIWGRGRSLSHPLRDGDRVEVLRELQIDPMDARRLRYEAAGGVDALRKRGYAGRKR